MEEALHTYLKDIDIFFQKKKYQNSPDALYKPIDHILSTGGKRIRSILVLLGFEGYGDDYTAALPLAFAIELFHNFTLVHDDIMDAAPIRRGVATVHEKYGTNSAILSGDVMHSYVFKELSQLDPKVALLIIERFSDVAIKVCEGQSYDMVFEDRDNVGIAEYLDMIEMKTAVLIGLALEVGALLGGADKTSAHHLYQFGKSAGIAFQLQDDYLDLYGEKTKVGKQICGDIIQKKKNYFYVKAYDLLEDEVLSNFVNLYNSDIDQSERVKEVLSIYDDLYLKNYIKESKQAYLDLASSHLDLAGYNPSKIDLLKMLAIQLADRSS